MRICFVGDSLTQGTGDPECLGWPGRLGAAAWQRGHDVTVYNLGIRGDTSADVARRWRAEAGARLPVSWKGEPVDGRLVFSFGTNDCNIWDGERRVPVAETLANARAVLTEAAEARPVLMVGPPPLTDDAVDRAVVDLTDELAALCGEIGVPFLPVAEAILAVPEWRVEVLAGDGAHPGARGYAALAALVDEWEAWRAWLP